ncbi:MAG: SURF1 family protein [Burkholderiaceae bacterium]|nr:SURF1 family protein [Burkholderiaceae bacterium]
MLASLGMWQLSRAAEKEALQSLLDERARMPALSGLGLPAVSAQGDAVVADLIHRPVVLEGRWLSDKTIYLDNRQMQGRPGFFVLTPLLLEGPEGRAVLVQRGWAPRNFEDRAQVPPVETPTNILVRVQGRIAQPPSRLFEFQTRDQSKGFSRIRQNLDISAFGSEIGLALPPLTVVQMGEASEGLQRDWFVVGAGVDKHYGYAFQWFGLCGLIALLYVWFQIVRPLIRSRSQPAP